MKSLICLLALAVALAMPCLAGTTVDSETITVRARIETISPSLNITINEVKGDNWTTRNSVDFGNLVFDGNYDVWRAESYYAVDVGVSGNVDDWTITHTASPVTGPGGDLDENINVTFIQQVTDLVGIDLDYVSYLASDGKSYTKDDLFGGWLRIYYGIAGGEDDAPGVEPIGADATPGTYVGTVTLTLTEN